MCSMILLLFETNKIRLLNWKMKTNMKSITIKTKALSKVLLKYNSIE